MARYLSPVTSDETKSVHFAMELLCLCEHWWETIVTIACL